MDLVIAPLADKKESGGLFGLNSAYAPSLDEILAYDLDPSGLVGRFEDQLRAIEQDWTNSELPGMVSCKKWTRRR